MTTKLQPYQGSYLTPSLEKATVRDAMRTGVMGCEPDLPASTVARMMATHHIHAVVVEGIHDDPVHGERLSWGVVSDMDLLRAARAGIEELTAGEIAATEPVTVEPSLSLVDALRLMEEHEITHLIVADGGRPVGILSTLDVAGVLAWGRA
jgi:CBS domain-containing protein